MGEVVRERKYEAGSHGEQVTQACDVMIFELLELSLVALPGTRGIAYLWPGLSCAQGLLPHPVPAPYLDWCLGGHLPCTLCLVITGL